MDVVENECAHFLLADFDIDLHVVCSEVPRPPSQAGLVAGSSLEAACFFAVCAGFGGFSALVLPPLKALPSELLQEVWKVVPRALLPLLDRVVQRLVVGL